MVRIACACSPILWLAGCYIQLSTTKDGLKTDTLDGPADFLETDTTEPDTTEPDTETGTAYVDSVDTGGDSDTDTDSDADSDTDTDTGLETGVHTGAETGADTGAETGTDTGADTGADTGGDTGADSDTDTDSDSDADSDTDSDSDADTDTDTGAVAQPVFVTWWDEILNEGCTPFSQPQLLGADATWLEVQDLVTLDFVAPSWEASFTGSWSGSELSLVNVEIFSFHGLQWQTTETLTGTLTGTTLSGSYSYAECAIAVDPTSCPDNGFCKVTAAFSLEVP